MDTKRLVKAAEAHLMYGAEVLIRANMAAEDGDTKSDTVPAVNEAVDALVLLAVLHGQDPDEFAATIGTRLREKLAVALEDPERTVRVTLTRFEAMARRRGEDF